MSRFGFIGSSYTSQSVNADCQLTLNWYLEIDESGLGKSAQVLYPTPGLAVRYALTDGPVRGNCFINSRAFYVSGSTLFEVFANGSFNNRGTVANDGLPVSMVANAEYLLIASAGTPYVLTLATNALANISAVLPYTISQVNFSDGFFVALVASSQQWFISAPEDATTWDLTNFGDVSVYPDNVLAMAVLHREIWMFGIKATTVYYNAGAPLFPFLVNSSAGVIEQGIAAISSVAHADNSLFWLGGDDRGDCVVWRASGYTPTRVSNHAVEFAMQGYAKVSDAIAYTYQDQGHIFYVLYFPTANKTWVFDVATSQWHERAFFSNGTFTAHRSMCHQFVFGQHFVGDWNSGNVYEMSISLSSDFGNQIKRIRRAPHISTEQQWITHHQLQIDCEVGLGPIPPFQGSAPPSSIFLEDANGDIWRVQANDSGQLVSTNLGSADTDTPQTIILNDAGNAHSFLLGIGTNGQLTTTLQTLGSFEQSYLLNSSTGQKIFFLQVIPAGNLQTAPGGVVARGPQMTLRWSDDGGHTWSNEYTRDCGQAGQYRTRVIWRRLGRSRDRVYEVSVTDPIPWRIVDADLIASPNFQPQERLPKQLSKIA